MLFNWPPGNYFFLQTTPTYKRIRGPNPLKKEAMRNKNSNIPKMDNPMKKILVLAISVLMLQIAYAHEEKVIDPGITPDSFLWGLDKALDNLNLLLTFNPAEKARKGIEIARERLEEVKVMAEQNKLEAAEKGKEEQLKILSKVKQNIADIKEENATKQIQEEIEIEKELEEHEDEVKEVSDNLKIKIEVKGALNEQQKALLNSLLSSLENKTSEVKVEIKNKKDETKIKIKAETGKSEKDVEDEIEHIEEEQGLASIKKEHATEEIDNTKENIDDLEKELQEHKSEGHVANETPITTLIDNAKEKISNAEEAFKANNFGEAFGQANAAEQLIKNAKRILEKTVERFEEEEKGHEIEEKQEIEVEIKDGEAKIKVEIGSAKLKFTMETTNKNAIIQEISERTGLSIDEVAKLAKFEEQKGEVGEAKEKKIKIEINETKEKAEIEEKTRVKGKEDKDKEED